MTACFGNFIERATLDAKRSKFDLFDGSVIVFITQSSEELSRGKAQLDGVTPYQRATARSIARIRGLNAMALLPPG
jgi:hypothetical protein